MTAGNQRQGQAGFQRGGPGYGWSNAGRGTRGLVVAMVIASMVAAVAQRVGIAPLQSWAVLHVPKVIPGLELWRLVTHLFIEVDPFGLALGALVLWFLGAWFEQRYGTRAMIQFFFIAGIGAAILAIPLTYVLDLALGWFYTESGGATGPNAVLDAIIISIALVTPDSNILLGFVLPIKARTVVYIIIAFAVASAIMIGAADLASTLGGLAMGWLLTTGWWRPSRWFAWWRHRQAKAATLGRFDVIDGDRPSSGPDKPRYYH